jgi:hypothetical protein
MAPTFVAPHAEKANAKCANRSRRTASNSSAGSLTRQNAATRAMVPWNTLPNGILLDFRDAIKEARVGQPVRLEYYGKNAQPRRLKPLLKMQLRCRS